MYTPVKFLLGFFCFGTLLMVGCQKPLEIDDNEPKVDFVRVNGGSDSLIVSAGDTLNFEMGFSDDVELDKYRIQILPEFIGFPGLEVFELAEVVPLAGTSSVETRSVAIAPSVTAGIFTIVVEALDVEGNLSTDISIPLVIQRAGMPTINLQNPNINAIINLPAGDTLTTNGIITDDEAIRQVRIEIADLDNVAGVNTLYLRTYDYTSDFFTTWSLDSLVADSIPVNLPASTLPGDYTFSVAAFDTTGNYSIQRGTVRAN